jgi:signal transduction histidine kinase
MTSRSSHQADGDSRAIRRASLIVGIQIAVASTALVVAVLAATLVFVLREIKPAELFEPVPDPDVIHVRAPDLFAAGIVLGVVAIVLAGTMSWLVTRRAVRPLGDALRIQRQFVADASHELRTPLTVLDARLQVLQRTIEPSDDTSTIVSELRQDTKALVDIVNDLLEAAEAAGSSRNGKAAVDFLPAVESTVKSMQVLAVEHGVRIEITEARPALTYLPSASIQRCVGALVDNAVRHSPAGSVVDVSVTTTRSEVTLAVVDRGSGIQGIEPSRIFDRFAHSGEVHTRSGRPRIGFGIGLALVRDIVARYGGHIEVRKTSPLGTEIVLTVPRVQNR